MLTKLFILISGALVAFAQEEKEGINYHKPISWQAPSTALDFDNWEFYESSVMYTNKILLAPTGENQYGFIRNTWVSCCSKRNFV